MAHGPRVKGRGVRVGGVLGEVSVASVVAAAVKVGVVVTVVLDVVVGVGLVVI